MNAQTMQTTELFCVNMLHTGCAFGVTPEGVQTYIPASVVRASNLRIGDTVAAVVIPNVGDRRDRTPLFAVRIDADMATPVPVAPAPVAPAPAPAPTDLAAAIRELVLAGGIWSQGKLFRKFFPNSTREDNLTEYNKINHTLRAMFADGECAKVSLWRSGEVTKPGFEWFTADRDAVVEAMGGK